MKNQTNGYKWSKMVPGRSFLHLGLIVWPTNITGVCLIKLWLLSIFWISIACEPGPGKKDNIRQAPIPEEDIIPVSHAIGFGIRSSNDRNTIYLYRHYANSQDTLIIEAKEGIKRLVVLAAPHVAMLDTLAALDRLIAISSREYFWNPRIMALVEKGDILEIGSEQSLDIEQLLALRPDMVIVSAFPGSPSPFLYQLQLLGVDVLPMAEWQETTLLGRAEWIKVLGAMVGKQELASKLFNEMVEEYLKVTQLTDTLTKKPLILSSLPYKGLWSVPGGNSYMGRLLKEAGADYYWQNTPEKGSIPLDFEAVYPVGLKAEVWLSPGSVTTMNALLSQDNRFADFPSVQMGRVYHNYKRSVPGGGNDYWESGVINPHLVLSDLVKILHPDLLPAHDLVYFAPLQ